MTCPNQRPYLSPKLIAINRCCVPVSELGPYAYICKLFFPGCIANDRFDWLTQFSRLDWQPVNQRNTLDLSNSSDFMDIVETRVSELIQKAQGKKTIISWSGGIDSSFLAVLFIEHGFDVEVYCTVDSITESPFLLEYFDYLNIKSVIAPRRQLWSRIEQERDYFLISGQCADQCFAFKVLNKYPDLYDLPWTDAVDRYIGIIEKDHELCFSYDRYSKDLIKSYLDSFGVKTWAQFCIFWNNCVKSNFTAYNDLLLADTAYLRQNHAAFFATPEFLNWGLIHNCLNLDFNYVESPLLYKPQMKAYLKSVLHTDYFDLKEKTPSEMFCATLRKFTVLDTEGFKQFENMNGFDKYQKLLTLYRKEGY